MSLVLVDDTYLSDIAGAIRTKLGVATTYKPSEMATAILTISGGGTVTVNGAPSTAVSYTGPESGSFTLDSSGTASLVLSGGNYTFTNTVTIDGIGYTITQKTQGVAGNTTVNLFPAGYIYWFGKYPAPVGSIANGASYSNPTGGWASMTAMNGDTNCVSGSASTKNGIKWGSNGKVDTTGYSILKARAIISWTTTNNTYRNNTWRFMSTKDLSTSVASESLATISSDGTEAVTVMNLPSTAGEYYIGGYAGWNYNSNYGVTMKILAVWME